MAYSRSFVAGLKDLLPETSWSRVVNALHQDGTIWSGLQDPQFGKLALEKIGSQPESWTPAALAFLALDHPFLAPGVRLDPQLRHQAVRAYEDLIRDRTGELGGGAAIFHAGLLAITLLEHYRLSGCWENLKADLQPAFQKSAANGERWGAPLAILLGLAPDSESLLEELIFAGAPVAYLRLGLHALLSQPSEPESQIEIITSLVQGLPLENVNALLTYLSKHRPGIAARISRQLAGKPSTIPTLRRFRSYAERIEHLTGLLLQADLHQMAGQKSQSSTLRTLALQDTRLLQDDIVAGLIENAVKNGDIEAAVRIWQSPPAPKTPSFPPDELILAYLGAGRYAEAVALLPDGTLNDVENLPAGQLAIAQLAASTCDTERAREAARKSLKALEESGGAGKSGSQATVGLLRNLAALFLELSLPLEAQRAASLALAFRTNDPELLVTLAQSHRAAGEAAQAVESAHLAVSLDPDHATARFELARSLEFAGEWEDALEERQRLLEPRFADPSEGSWPNPLDLHSLAYCALHAGQPEQAKKTAQYALDQNDEDGIAQAILGEALDVLGEKEEAMKRFRLATQQAPHEPQPWLALAHAQQRNGESDKAIETLRAASHAVPDDSVVQLALAEAYLAQNAHTQALAILKQAHEISSRKGLVEKSLDVRSAPWPDSSDPSMPSRIALHLGTTLFRLGHLDQARRVLEDAYQAHPSYPGLAYAYGKNLVAQGEHQEALAPLAVAISACPQESGPYLDYARALLEVKAQPEEAVRALQRALDLTETNVQAKGSFTPTSPSLSDQPAQEEALEGQLATVHALMAEALAANGDLQSALDAYSVALESEIADEEDWRGRLSSGLGRVALQLGDAETALAALQEAARADPQNPEVQQGLSQAYAHLELPKEAMLCAHSAVQLAPDDVDTLSWFAGQALHLGEDQEVIPALKRATQLDPQRADLLLRLGDIQVRFGEADAAREAYRLALAVENPDPERLRQTATRLHDLEDYQGAIACLEKACQLVPTPDIVLLRDLAAAYHSSGNLEQALQTLEGALQGSPGDVNLQLFKSTLLMQLNRPQAAQAALEHALNLSPQDPELHKRLAIVLRSNGEVSNALSYAENMVAILHNAPSSPIGLESRAIAGELARAMLKPDYAQSIIREVLDAEKPAEEVNLPPEKSQPALPFYCLAAELALDREEDVPAAEALSKAFEISPDHVRVLALRARFTNRRGDVATGLKTLQTAVQKVNAVTGNELYDPIGGTSLLNLPARIADLHAVAEAAMEFNLWEVALNLTRKAAKMVPDEPYVHLQVARTLVLRAEYQRLCETLGVITHAPGSSALGEASFQFFTEALEAATRCLPVEENSLSGGSQRSGLPEAVSRWQARGNAVFKPGAQSLAPMKSFPHTHGDIAAYIAALASVRDLVAIAQVRKTLQEPVHHTVLAQLALALGFKGRRRDDTSDSLAAAIAALEARPGQPLYHALLAQLQRNNGDSEAALEAIQSALTLWPDEPRWHALAAELLAAGGQTTQAIQHLSKATHLEPNHLPHHMALGDAYLQNGDPNQAIHALEMGVQAAPDQVEPRLALARAYIASGDYDGAAKSAEEAISLAPNQMIPLLLRAEIAMRSGDARIAQKRAEAALQHNPDDPGALHLLSRALKQLGHLEDAMVVLERAVPLSDDPLPLLVEYANLIGSTQSSQAALDNLRELAMRYPDEPSVLAPLATALASAGQRDEAIRAAQRALHGKPTALDSKEGSRLHYLLGSLLRKTGQLDAAIHHLSEATRLDQEGIEAYLDLGATQQERRQHALALQTYQRAIQVAPDDPRPFYQAGLALKASHDYPEAEKMLRRAADLAPEDLSIHRQLGAIVALNLVYNHRTIPLDA